MVTTKEVQKMMSADPKIKMDVKMKLDVVCIQEDGDMGTADALRHIQQKIKVCVFLCAYIYWSLVIRQFHLKPVWFQHH